MNKAERTQIGLETMEITKQGSYVSPSGKTVALETGNSRSLYAVDLYPPEVSEEIVKKGENDPKPQGKCEFYLADADSFTAAERLNNPLVMNFANAHHPGGGFLRGASAQEEALCRTSTLYASISSKKAAAMYDYNNKLGSPVDSDYFLISPNVIVFRSCGLELLEEPYKVSVVTIAAPNRNGRAAAVKKSVLDGTMTVRLRKMLYTAADRGYRELVLGAWGCGAFGNDPRDVSGYFAELFFGEGLEGLFDRVIFAVLGGGRNYDAFAKAFGKNLAGEGLPAKKAL